MANNKRSASEKAYHQRKIAELHLDQGKTQAEIADILGISQATVSRGLESLRVQWQKEAAKRTEHSMDEKLVEFQRVKAAAWGGWHDSRGAVTNRLTITRKKGGEEIVELHVDTTPGDPRFLDQVQKALQLEMKLFGLDVDKSKLTLPPETMLLIQALGLNINDVVKTLSDILKDAAQSAATPPGDIPQGSRVGQSLHQSITGDED